LSVGRCSMTDFIAGKTIYKRSFPISEGFFYIIALQLCVRPSAIDHRPSSNGQQSPDNASCFSLSSSHDCQKQTGPL
jgi:hypothetical protein